MEKVYNQKRLHSALGYVPPGRVRGATGSAEQGGRCAAACYVSFSGMGKSIGPMLGEKPEAASVHRSRLSSASMSSSQLFLGGLRSSSARLRFTGYAQNAIK